MIMFYIACQEKSVRVKSVGRSFCSKYRASRGINDDDKLCQREFKLK